jgi:hypothetical protein
MTTKTNRSRLPKCISNMISTSYKRDESSATTAARINSSATAKKVGVRLTTPQVAAHFAWITMRNRKAS